MIQVLEDTGSELRKAKERYRWAPTFGVLCCSVLCAVLCCSVLCCAGIKDLAQLCVSSHADYTVLICFHVLHCRLLCCNVLSCATVCCAVLKEVSFTVL